MFVGVVAVVEDEMRLRMCRTEAGFRLYWIVILGRGSATVIKGKKPEGSSD